MPLTQNVAVRHVAPFIHNNSETTGLCSCHLKMHAEAAKGILIGLGSTDWRWKTWIFFSKGEHANQQTPKW